MKSQKESWSVVRRSFCQRNILFKIKEGTREEAGSRKQEGKREKGRRQPVR